MDEAFGALDAYSVGSELLAARSFKDSKSFVQLGKKYSRPRDEREERVKRLRLVISQQEAGYEGEYLRENVWNQGPFYYEESGRKEREKVGARGGSGGAGREGGLGGGRWDGKGNPEC